MSELTSGHTNNGWSLQLFITRLGLEGLSTFLTESPTKCDRSEIH